MQVSLLTSLDQLLRTFSHLSSVSCPVVELKIASHVGLDVQQQPDIWVEDASEWADGGGHDGEQRPSEG